MSFESILDNCFGFKWLDLIAVEVCHSNHGDFLKSFAEAWIRADPANKLILVDAWKRLIAKYKLQKEFAAVIKRELKENLKNG